MFRKIAAALIATTLIAGPALAGTLTPAAVTQPAKAGIAKSSVKHTAKIKRHSLRRNHRAFKSMHSTKNFGLSKRAKLGQHAKLAPAHTSVQRSNAVR